MTSPSTLAPQPTTSNRIQTVLFAGGGSGGHLSPGLAVAEALQKIQPATRTLFACSRRDIDHTMLAEAGVRHVAIPASPLALRPAGAVRYMRDYRLGRSSASRLLAAEQVDRVLALGGFVSAPVAGAAARLGIPVILLNLDAVPGKANRWIARRCSAVWSAVETPSRRGFDNRIVGMPIRQCATAPADAADCRRELGLDPQRPTLLVTGASQGAGTINDLLMALAQANPQPLDGWQILHLAGAGADQRVREAYQRAGTTAQVRPFLSQMGLAWGAADLAVSRAGASSVAEAAHNRVPTLFLPYPFHRDQHQARNAQPLVEAGAAAMVEDRVATEANLCDAGATLEGLLSSPEQRQAMQTALHQLPPNCAADTVARLLLAPSLVESED
jgi:UDP-N-acetylglucosamine--N-acetylmuramyl-(pentapeptide) pyrophosphoryl-undecaprenol N-acetylglucosamine transferase